MLGLTIIQPWPWAIFRASKSFENRTWRPPEKAIGQRIVIHAGLSLVQLEDPGVRDFIFERATVPLWKSEDILLGVVLGTALLAGYVEESEDPWFTGPYGWRLAEKRELARPIACRGMQGLWVVPKDVEALVAEQEAAGEFRRAA